ncbi:MAG: hypothetical protein AB8E15_11860 [Bdellovibrionales bacterium]
MLQAIFSKKKFKKLSQLELGIGREQEPDRNHMYGGRSFYFFDFDDNVAFLPTKMYLFHKSHQRELTISTGEYAKFHRSIGSEGPFKDYKIIEDDPNGSFRRFRDQDIGFFAKKFKNVKQAFVEDMRSALKRPEHIWQGPSWDCFYHAVFNKRPICIITARGHSSETIIRGISEMVNEGFLPHEPNYLKVFAVSNVETRKSLGDKDLSMTIPELKKQAIFQSVDLAFKSYGTSPFHRFGMSDDDSNNVRLVREAMRELKKQHANNSFFVIHSKGNTFTKEEVILKKQNSQKKTNARQLSLDF